MAFENWLLYLVAAIGLSLSPGPNGLLALTHGALHGGRRTLFTIAGGTVGFVLLIGLSLFGIGALLKASANLLSAMKWAGGAYLVWLGIQLWRAPAPGVPHSQVGARAGNAVLFRQGLLSAVTNPKGLLFFAAFLPQFIDPHRSLLVQFAVMAATFAVVEFATELAIALLAHRLRPWLQLRGRMFNRVCGGTFVGIGGLLPLKVP